MCSSERRICLALSVARLARRRISRVRKPTRSSRTTSRGWKATHTSRATPRVSGHRPYCVTRTRAASAATRGVAPGDLTPVHDVPPRREIIGAAVLIFQIVRVLPDVDAEYGVLTV